MRQALLRAILFGAAGAAVFAIAQVGLLLMYPRTFVSSLEVVVMRHIEAAAIAGSILSGGALIGFAAARNRLASARDVMVLGALAAIPAVLLANLVAITIGISGGIGVSVLLAGVVAYLGGGGLRSATSHV